MTFSKLSIKATIYNLAEQKQYIIKSPKGHEGCYAFSHNRRFLAIAEKREYKDYIGVYYCQNWRLVSVGTPYPSTSKAKLSTSPS